jgi:hypothetical protein
VSYVLRARCSVFGLCSVLSNRADCHENHRDPVDPRNPRLV